MALGVSMLPDRDLSVPDGFTRSIGGRAPASWSIWSYWGDSTGPFDTALLNCLKQRRVVPMVWWMSADPANLGSSPYTYSRISAGDHDAYIRSWATAARQFGSTVIVRFDHEMDGTWFSWGATRFDNTPAKFVAAWQHVVAIFRSVGATNVKFLWSPYTPRMLQSLAVATLCQFPESTWIAGCGCTTSERFIVS